jgi:hypothetical protein
MKYRTDHKKQKQNPEGENNIENRVTGPVIFHERVEGTATAQVHSASPQRIK